MTTMAYNSANIPVNAQPYNNNNNNNNMIMAMPLKPAPEFRHYQRLQNENPLSSCKAVIFVLLC